MTTRRLALLALLAVVLAAAAVAVRDPRSGQSSASLVSPPQEGEGREPVKLASTTFTSRGGRAQVRWTAGSFGGADGSRQLEVGLYVDDRRVATMLVGGRATESGSSPVALVWNGRLLRGARRILVRLERPRDERAAALQQGVGTLAVDER